MLTRRNRSRFFAFPTKLRLRHHRARMLEVGTRLHFESLEPRRLLVGTPTMIEIAPGGCCVRSIRLHQRQQHRILYGESRVVWTRTLEERWNPFGNSARQGHSVWHIGIESIFIGERQRYLIFHCK